MSLVDFFKRTKNPTVKQDYVAYAQGANSTYTSTFNNYVESVEALDKAIRVIANVASMAKFETYTEMANGTLRPLKIKNIDFRFNTNDQSSEHDLIAMIFGSIFTQGAAIILTSDNKKTKFKNFFSYDVSRFKVHSTENNMFNEFVYSSEGGSEVRFKPDDVIYIAPKVGSSNLVYAISRLEALNDILGLQSNIMRQAGEYYEAGGKQSAIISPKEPMSPEKAAQLKTAFDTFLQTPATKTLFINTEVDVKTVTNAQSPTQIMEALTKINDMIREQFGIPEYLYGTYNGYVNDASVVTSSRIFFQVHLLPVFKAIEYQFTKYFRNTLKLKGAIVKFNFDDIEILRDNMQSKIDQASAMYKLGLISMNEARVMCEREPVKAEAADRHFVPSYLTGQMPVSIEQFDETMNKLFASDGVTSSMPDGNAGGDSNENIITGSTGGPGNTGE